MRFDDLSRERSLTPSARVPDHVSAKCSFAETDSVKFMPAIQSQSLKNTCQSFVAYFFKTCNCILNPGDASWLCDTYSGHAERVPSQVDRIYFLPQIKAPLWNCYAGRYSAQISSSMCNCIHVHFHCCA